ncbi:unnamed protein product [Chrysoparadoxa australica]
MSSLLEADDGKTAMKAHHALNLALLASPVGILAGPGVVGSCCDVALGFAIPMHAHIGLNFVISDYVPKASRGAARMGLLAVTGLTVLGLQKLNFTGPGITQSALALWKGKKEEEAKTS